MLKKSFKLSLILFSFIFSSAYTNSPSVIDLIHEEAKSHFSDAVIIQKDGKILYQMYSTNTPEKIPVWSITKSFVSLGIGFLYDDGKISVDRPVSDFLPGWNKGKRKEITVRHLLTHTSGIDPSCVLSEISAPENCIEYAYSKEIIHEPGTVFAYNNHAVNLLAAIIFKVSGVQAEEFLREKLFAPLEISDYIWDCDNANNSLGACGLHMKADDLLKVGQFLLDKGMWKGKRLLSEEWLNASITPSGFLDKGTFPQYTGCGFLFWVNEDPDFFSAVGYLGQYLTIFPEKKIIAIRQHHYKRDDLGEIDPERRYFRQFLKYVSLLSKDDSA